jgi:hypothetical protein
MTTDYRDNIYRANLFRVRTLGLQEGWTDDHLGALVDLFHPALIVKFKGEDVRLADGRLIGRSGVIGSAYDKAAWARTLASLEAPQ